MTTFRLTTDIALIRSLLCEPRSFRRMVNDAAPSPERFAEIVQAHESQRYVVGEVEGAAACLFVIQAYREDHQGVDVHFSFVPEAWGRTADIAADFVAWMWRETDAAFLVGNIPSYNRLALRLALSLGFVPYEQLENIGFKHGKPFAVICTKLQRPKREERAA